MYGKTEEVGQNGKWDSALKLRKAGKRLWKVPGWFTVLEFQQFHFTFQNFVKKSYLIFSLSKFYSGVPNKSAAHSLNIGGVFLPTQPY